MYFYNNFKLGVLGGGQLGRMLMQPCTNFNVFTSMLDGDENSPCKGIANEFICGEILDYDTVYNFGKDKDVVTIEIENVNIEALKKLESEGVKVYPQPNVIEIIKDKRRQKEFYKSKGIPTADFILTESKIDVSNFKEFLPAFHKLGTGGYDGGGVVKISTVEDLDKAFDAPGLLEKFIDFQKEISVIVARNPDGQVRAFPVVECVFHPEHNLVDYLISPAKLSVKQEAEAQEIAQNVIESFGMVGILAVEMFITKEGNIVVNEVAPRPHNSGHQTIDGNVVSQYEQHLRAILNLPLGDTSIKLPSAMVNLLGEEGYTGDAIYKGIEDLMAMDGVNILLYGKKVTKPYRKMGHITILNENVDALKKIIEEVKQKIKIIA